MIYKKHECKKMIEQDDPDEYLELRGNLYSNNGFSEVQLDKCPHCGYKSFYQPERLNETDQLFGNSEQLVCDSLNTMNE